jgi:hypothetical protein
MPNLSSATRRARLPLLVAALLLCALTPAAARAQAHAHHGHASAADKTRHPAPRRGITAEHVLPADSVESERAREVYTMAARIPGILDGLYCHCDCHERDGLRSLLECFHNEMAGSCGICQGQARLAHEMRQEGKSLSQIRKAIDDEYGP